VKEASNQNPTLVLQEQQPRGIKGRKLRKTRKPGELVTRKMPATKHPLLLSPWLTTKVRT
jgi:hypothetical protein